jgi:hypothetical protein
VHRIGLGPVLQSPTPETSDPAPLGQLPLPRYQPTASAAADQPPPAFWHPRIAHAITVLCCLSTAESVGDSKPSSSLRSPLLASPFTSATLQRCALPRQPPPVGLRLSDLLEHRPNLGLLPEPSAAAWSRPQVTRCRLVHSLRPHHRCRLSSSTLRHDRHGHQLRPSPRNLDDHFNASLNPISGLPPMTLLLPSHSR